MFKAAFVLGALEQSFSGAFLKRLGDSSSGFSLSQFVVFLHVTPARLDDDQIRSLCGAQKSHWIITING